MQRACAAALLRKGVTEIIYPGHSQDDQAAMDVIGRLGAVLEHSASPGEVLNVRSEGVRPADSQIHCGESGLGIRMFTPLAALSTKQLTITGSGSLVSRPMHFFDEIFPQLGIRIQTNGGKVPLQVQGPLKPASIEVDGSLSSQFLTGLLMAYSAAGASDVEIRVRDLKSKPYIDLTLDVMRAFGMHMPENRVYESFYFPALQAREQPAMLRYMVEGDWSGAAFLVVAGAISGNLRIEGLQRDSSQADKAILKALDAAGVECRWEGEDLVVSRRDSSRRSSDREGEQPIPNGVTAAKRGEPVGIQAFSFDATECPDLFPPLVALAAYANGVSEFRGASRLTHKESNRALTLQEEFGKLGVRIDLTGDLMRVHGGGPLHGAVTHSRHDHRIAMALAVAGLRSEGPVIIEEAQAIGKSYPDFFRDLQTLGVQAEIQEEATIDNA
jgi:3-phosphoshikimate 1-carboxyvinyltransferase